MEKKNSDTLLLILKPLFWILLIGTIIVFYYSLRQTDSGFTATLYALVLWGITYLVHLAIKRLKKIK
jgi:hypothetical protein